MIQQTSFGWKNVYFDLIFASDNITLSLSVLVSEHNKFRMWRSSDQVYTSLGSPKLKNGTHLMLDVHVVFSLLRKT